MTNLAPCQHRPHVALVVGHPTRTGGMEKFCRFLVRSLLADGWPISVALSGENIYDDLADGATGTLMVERVDWLDSTFAGDRTCDWKTILDRRAWFARVRPEVAVFVQSSNTPLRASIIGARLAGVPVVSTHRTMAWPVEDSPRGRHLFGLIPGLGLHGRRVVAKTWLTSALTRFTVFNSHHVGRGYQCHYRYARRKARVIPNAIDLPDMMETPGVDDGGLLTIGYVGRLSREKRIDVLLRAVADLPTVRPVRVALYGDGPERDKLNQLAGELGLADRVNFHGPTDDVSAAYRRCDIVALCSPRESSSNMILEAMADGRAVIVTRTGGMPELIDYGRSGLCVPALDVEALREALARLITDNALRGRLGTRARQTVQQRHASPEIVVAWKFLLREATRSKRRLPFPRIGFRRTSDKPADADFPALTQPSLIFDRR